MNRLICLGVLAAVACSPVTGKSDDGGTNNPDAASSDGGGGDPPDATGPGMVTARVLDNDSQPMPGASVAFNDADGSLISVKTTDANGEATEIVAVGAMVSAGWSTSSILRGGAAPKRYVVSTRMGVQPGDNLTFGGSNREPTFGPLGSSNLQLPSTAPPNTDHYTVGNTCSYAYLGLTDPRDFVYSFRDDKCSGKATQLDLLGFAWTDQSQSTASAWTMFAGVVAGNASTYSSSGWNTNFDQFNAFVTDSPFAGDVRLEVTMFRGGYSYDLQTFDGNAAITAGSNASYIVPIPPGFPEKLRVTTQITSTAGDQLFLHSTNLAATKSNSSVAATSFDLPGVTNVSLDTSDASRPALRWNYSGTVPASAQAVLSMTSWNNSVTAETWTWEFLGPADTVAPMKAPALPNRFVTNPDDTSPRWPPMASAVVRQQLVGVIQSDVFADWAELRQSNFSLVGDVTFIDSSAPADASAVVSVGGIFAN